MLWGDRVSRESLIAKLQTYRQKARENTLENTPGRDKDIVYPPEVMDRRLEILSSLCIKHKAKLQSKPPGRGNIYGVLVATATRMALEQLGLIKGSKSGFHRIRAMNMLRVQLGIRDKREDQVANNRRKRAKALVTPCRVTQVSLEGV